jgi:hypothetical protein
LLKTTYAVWAVLSKRIATFAIFPAFVGPVNGKKLLEQNGRLFLSPLQRL